MPNLQGAAVRSLRPESWDFFGVIQKIDKLGFSGKVGKICPLYYPPQMLPMMWRMSRKHAFTGWWQLNYFFEYFFKFSPRKYLEKWSNLTFAYFSTGLKPPTSKKSAERLFWCNWCCWFFLGNRWVEGGSLHPKEFLKLCSFKAPNSGSKPQAELRAFSCLWIGNRQQANWRRYIWYTYGIRYTRNWIFASSDLLVLIHHLDDLNPDRYFWNW